MKRLPNLPSLALFSSLALTACSGRHEPAAASRPAAPASPSATAPSSAPAAPETLTFDAAQSSVRFTASKITASHEGRFSDVSGHLTFDAADPSRSRFDVRVGIASLSIEPARLQGHLLTPDLLDAAGFADATFRSVSLAPVAGSAGTYTVTGDLTIHGRTKRLSFPTTITVSAESVLAGAEVLLDRRDFGVIYPGMPDDLIRDEVALRVSLLAPRAH